MRVIAVRNLRDFWKKHPAAKGVLLAWLHEAKAAQWRSPADIKALYPTAGVLKSRRVVFNIKGNEYRLVAAVAYRYGAVYIKFVCSHAQYDAIDADFVEMTQ